MIPNSLDNLALGGILPYDVNAYIYDRPSTLRLPYSNPYDSYIRGNVPPYGMPQYTPAPYAPQAPGAKTNKKDNFLNKAGKAALAAAAFILTGAFLKKKFPNAAVTNAFKQVGEYVSNLPSRIINTLKSVKIVKT